MRVMKISGMLLLAGLIAALAPMTSLAAPVAQEQNLLANPGFEQPYDGGKQASGWGRWFEETPKPGGGSLDYVVGPEFSAEVNTAIVRSGGASQHIGNRYDPWHAGVKQTVTVAPRTPLRFCAFGRLFANNEDFERAPSVPSKDGQVQVGIFPNGEVEWDNGGIIWSGKINPHDAWQQVCVEATAGDAGKVTVFTSANYRGQSAYHLDAWWDDASLVSIAPAATAAPTQGAAPPPQATISSSGCQTREDGTVVYVVQSGDTLFGIALACDSTVDTIRQLNNLTSDLISIGQTLIVKAPAGATLPPAATPVPTQASATATATLEATQVAVAPTEEPTPVATDGSICVEAFNDANTNRSKDGGEQLLGGVGFTLSDTTGPKGSYVTSGLEVEPYCFGGLQPGSYTVDARSPVGVANTTDTQWRVGLTAGMQFDVQYGGARTTAPVDPNAPAGAQPTEAPTSSDAGDSAQGDSSNLGRIALGGLGVVILLAAGFMANLIWARSRR